MAGEPRGVGAGEERDRGADVLRLAEAAQRVGRGGFVLVLLAACLSSASLLSLGPSFGFRPALRGLATHGAYGFVRHPMYLAYFIGDIGYELYEWNPGTLLIVAAGWASLIYRINAEERILSQGEGWTTYASTVRYRLFPGIW